MSCPQCSTVYYAQVRLCPSCGTSLASGRGEVPVGTPIPVRSIGAITAALLAVDAVSLLVLTLLRALGESTTPGITLTVPAAVLTVPAFLVWFFRIRHNAGLWGPQRRDRGWAFWGWLVPVVNLWFPYRIAADASTPEQVGPVESRTTLALVRAWWAAWLLAAVTDLSGGHRRVWLEFAVGNNIASSAFAAASALLAMRMVRRLTAVQDARISRPALFLVPIRPVPTVEETQSPDPPAPPKPSE
jgi:hypothetical protein